MGEGAQSGDFIDAIANAVGSVPWYVIALLVAVILTGVVILVTGMNANRQAGGGDLSPGGRKKPRK